MNGIRTLHNATVVFSFALAMAGCATTQTQKSDEKSEPPVATSATTNTNKPAASPAVSAQKPVQPPVVVANPTIITFEKMGVALTEKDKVTVSQISVRAKASKKVELTGYCDRNQVGNPVDAAWARAVAVKDELVALGVSPASITIKSNIKIAKKHAVEVLFN